MKKTVALILSLFIILMSFVACSGGGEDEISLAPEDTENVIDNFALVYNDVAFRVGDLMMGKNDCVLKKLGKPVSSSATNSCAYQGLDKSFEYSGFTIDTYPDGNLDYILRIVFNDDVMTTQNGIHIGSTLDEVKAAYGAAEVNGGNISYTSGKTIITMKIVNDAVTALQFDLIED